MAKKANLQGSMTALVTPFKDGKVDEQAFRAEAAKLCRVEDQHSRSSAGA